MDYSKRILSLGLGAICFLAVCGEKAFAIDTTPSATDSAALIEERRQTKALLEKLAAKAADSVQQPTASGDANLLKKLQAAEKAKRQLQFQQESFVSEILRLKTKIREIEAQSPQAEEEGFAKREEELLEQLRIERIRAEKYKKNAGSTKESFREVQRAEHKAKQIAGELERNRLILNKRNKKIAELEAKINELLQGSVKNSELRDSLIKARQAAQRFEVQLEQRKHLDSDNTFLRNELAQVKAEASSQSEKQAAINLLQKKVEESAALLAELRAQKQALEAHLASQSEAVNASKKLAQKVKILERTLEEKNKVIATTTGLGTNIKELHQEIAKVKAESLKREQERKALAEELAKRDALLDKHRQALVHVKEKIDSHDAVLTEKEEELLATKRQLSKTIEETRLCSLSNSESLKEIAKIPSLKSELEETSKKLASATSTVTQCANDLDSSRKLLSKLSALEKDLIASKNELMLKDTEITLLSQSGSDVNEEAKRMLASIRAQQKHMRAASANSTERARLAPAATAKQPAVPQADVMIVKVTGKKVNLRSGPGEEHSAVKQVGEGISLTVEDRKGDWYRVFAPTGERAYINADFVELIDNGMPKPVASRAPSRRPQKAVRTAGDEELVSFGAVKIGGRKPIANDPAGRAVQRLRSSLGQQGK